jgi:predicted nucleic acid-binding Zn ribbon protein
MTKLSLLLPKALRQLPPTDDLAEKLVLSVWQSAVGEALAQRTKPFRLYQSTLIVVVPSLMWKRELHYLQDEIVEKLHRVLGQKIVRTLEFRVDVEFDSTSLALPAPNDAEISGPVFQPADCIKDEGLRRAFVATASGCLNRTR